MKKPSKDLNGTAYRIVSEATGRYVAPRIARSAKGGEARSENLSPERRSEIAKKAAEARWKKEV